MKSVYIISKGDDIYKIGISNNPEARAKVLSIGNDVHLDVVFVSKPIENAHKIELETHKAFENYRIKGEWFKIYDIETVKERINTLIDEIGQTTSKIRNDNKKDIIISNLFQVEEMRTDYKTLSDETRKENEKILRFYQYLNGTLENKESEYGVLLEQYSYDDASMVSNLRLVASLIGIGWGYEQIKTFIVENVAKKLNTI